MRLVIDTNIFISAALKAASWPATTLRWVVRHGGLLNSAETASELLAVLQRPRFAGKIDPTFSTQVCQILAAVFVRAEVP